MLHVFVVSAQYVRTTKEMTPPPAREKKEVYQ